MSSVSEMQDNRRAFLVVTVVLLLVACAAYPWVRAHQAKQAFADCRARERNIGTALEMYSTDNSGRFPTALRQISPKYLAAVPTCPNHPVDYKYVSASNPDAYTIICEGDNHLDAGYPRDTPSYTSTYCILER